MLVAKCELNSQGLMESKVDGLHYLHPFRIGGPGGGHIAPLPSLSIFFNNSKSNQDSLFIFSDFQQNRVRNFLPKNQGHRPYLGLSTAFFPT